MKEYQVTVNRTEKKDIRFRMFASDIWTALAMAKDKYPRHKCYWDSISIKETATDNEGRE